MYLKINKNIGAFLTLCCPDCQETPRIHCPCLLCDQPQATAITTRSSVAFIAECPSGCEHSSGTSRLLHRCWSQAASQHFVFRKPSRAESPGPGLTEAPTEPHRTSATFRGGTLSGKCKMLDTVFIQFLLGGGDTEVEVELEGGLVTLEYYVVS